MLAVPVCSTQIIRICGLKILHLSIVLSIYCRCVVGLALHGIQIGVNEPEGVFSSTVILAVLHFINFYTVLFLRIC
jgi:hypothetical protein